MLIYFCVVTNKGNVRRRDRAMFKTELISQHNKIPVRVSRRVTKTENVVKWHKFGVENHQEDEKCKPDYAIKEPYKVEPQDFAQHMDSDVILRKLQQAKNVVVSRPKEVKNMVWIDSSRNNYIYFSDVHEEDSVSDSCSEMSFS